MRIQTTTPGPVLEACDGGCTPGSSGEWAGRCTKCGQPC